MSFETTHSLALISHALAVWWSSHSDTNWTPLRMVITRRHTARAYLMQFNHEGPLNPQAQATAKLK